MKIDKENEGCAFSEETHTYWNVKDDSKYISVTTLIGKYCQEFDSVFWSKYKALQALVDSKTFKLYSPKLLDTKRFDDKIIDACKLSINDFVCKQNEILSDWDKKKEDSCIRGTAIHLEKELEYYKSENNNIKLFGLSGNFLCRRNNFEMDLDRGVYPEYLISGKISKNLQVAGQIDLLIKDGNDIYIADHKTNAKIDKQSYFDRKKNSHECMKFPLNKVMDCNYYHYTMQLSMYAYLLQLRNPEFNIKELLILHYRHDGVEDRYKLDYMKKECADMLKHYEKQIVHDNIKKKNAKIVY